jgi:hypothetical protein
VRKCPKCDAEVTTYDKKCPSCRHPLSDELEATRTAPNLPEPNRRTRNLGWQLFCLRFAQVLAILGIGISLIYPIFLVAMKQYCLILLSPIGIIAAFAQYYVYTICIEYTEDKQRGARG